MVPKAAALVHDAKLVSKALPGRNSTLSDPRLLPVSARSKKGNGHSAPYHAIHPRCVFLVDAMPVDSRACI